MDSQVHIPKKKRKESPWLYVYLAFMTVLYFILLLIFFFVSSIASCINDIHVHVGFSLNWKLQEYTMTKWCIHLCTCRLHVSYKPPVYWPLCLPGNLFILIQKLDDMKQMQDLH